MGRTKVPAWRNTHPSVFHTRREKPIFKTFRTGIRDSDRDREWSSHDDGDADAELLDNKQKESELVKNVSPMSNSIGKNMGKTNEHAWRNTDTAKKKLKPKQKIGKNIGKTKQQAWRNSDTSKTKLKHTQKLLDDDDSDVELLHSKQEECVLVENVSPMSASIDKNTGKTKEHAWRNTHTSKKKLKLTQKLLDDDSDVELLDPKQEECMLVENVSPMPASLEKFSSPQSSIICVRGYKVKRSNATILEAIFKKHGDIAAECVFKTDSVRSSILEVVCEVVRQIQTKDFIEKMEELKCRVSDAKAANIDVSWLQAHLEAIYRRKEVSNKCNLLMEMKANTILVKKAAQKDLRERCAELVAAQQRFEKAETCVRVLHLVEKNLNDNILESKAKIDSWVNHPVV